MDSQRLKGRRALVTGAAQGIGLAVARRFAAEGAAVVVNYRRDPEEAEAALGTVQDAARAAGHAPRAVLVRADLAVPAEAAGLVGRAAEALGGLDILVNNAGLQAPTPSDGDDPEELERIIAVNLLGVAHASRAAIRHFLSRPGGGCIISTSSVHERIPKPGYLAYSMSKGGLGNLTRTLALEYADRGIRVNAVGPGAILTAMNDAWRNDPAMKESVERHIPMGYAATSEELAPVFAFLASDEARYVTGQTLYADGGLTLYGDFKENWSS